MSVSLIILWFIIAFCAAVVVRELFFRKHHPYVHCRYCGQPAPDRDLRIKACSECGRTHRKGARSPDRHRRWWQLAFPAMIVGFACGGYLAGPVWVAQHTPSFLLARIAPIPSVRVGSAWDTAFANEFLLRTTKSDYMEQIYLERWLTHAAASKPPLLTIRARHPDGVIPVRFAEIRSINPPLLNAKPLTFRVMPSGSGVEIDRQDVPKASIKFLSPQGLKVGFAYNPRNSVSETITPSAIKDGHASVVLQLLRGSDPDADSDSKRLIASEPMNVAISDGIGGMQSVLAPATNAPLTECVRNMLAKSILYFDLKGRSVLTTKYIPNTVAGGTTIGVDLQILVNHVVVGAGKGCLTPETSRRSRRYAANLEVVVTDANALAEALSPGHTGEILLSVKRDPAVALQDFSADKYWSGEVSLPVGTVLTPSRR